MKTHLRFLLTALLALVGMTSWAETHVWDPAALTDGTIISLQCRDTNGGSNYFFNGGAVKSPTLGYANLYRVVADGTKIKLQRLSDDKFVSSTSPVTMVDADASNVASFRVARENPTGWDTQTAGTDQTKTLRFYLGDSNNKLNAQGAGSVPTYVAGTGGYSIWYVYTYTEADVESVQVAAAYRDLLTQAQEAINYAKSTESGWRWSTIVNDPANIYSPKTESPDNEPGTGVHCLIDNNPSTYWHSSWLNPGNKEDHYLQFDLGEAYSNLQMQYQKRQNQGANVPQTFSVTGSNDGETFESLKTIEIENPGDDAIRHSWNIENETAYRYIRVHATTNGQGTENKGFWHASEMNFYFYEDYKGPNIYTKAGDIATQIEAILANPAENPTQADYDTLNALYDQLQYLIDNPDTDPDPELPRVFRPGNAVVGQQYYICSQLWSGGAFVERYLTDVDGVVKQAAEKSDAAVWTVEASDLEGYIYLKSAAGRYFDRIGVADSPVYIQVNDITDPANCTSDSKWLWCYYPSNTGNNRVPVYNNDGRDRGTGQVSGTETGLLPKSSAWSPYVLFYNINGEEMTVEEFQTELAENLTAAQTAIAYAGLGYPAAESEARTALAAAIEAAENYDKPNYDLVTNLKTATVNFYSCTDIEKPVIGKYYRLGLISGNDKSQIGYLTYAEEGTGIQAEYSNNAVVKVESINEDGKFIFKYAEPDVYMIYRNHRAVGAADCGENEGKGYATTYEDNYAAFAITPVGVGESFGLVALTTAMRNTTNASAGCLTFGNDGAWNGGSSPFFQANATSAFKMEEVEYTEPVRVAELTLSYVLNETKTKATVTVEGLVEAEESTTVWFLNDDEEAAGMLENGNTFEVSPTNAPETIKVTVRQYDSEMTTVLAEGEISIDFPEAVIIKEELTLSYELNKGQNIATVTVDGLTGQGNAAYFLDEDEEPYGFEGTTFEVAANSTPATVKVTVREFNDDMSIIYAEGETTIEFPEHVVVYPFVAEAGNTVDDELTADMFAATNSTYTDFNNVNGTSGAVYAGNSAKNNTDAIQLRSKNNSAGIVSTTSGGILKKVTVEWNSATAEGRTLDVYGSNEPFTQATDLYGTAFEGKTLLGSIVNGTSTELEIEGNYAYVGLRSKSDAMYLDKVVITWGEEGEDAPVVAPTFSVAAGTYNEVQTVALSVEDEDAEIFFALGEEDELSSDATPYTEPIQISKSTLVRAFAVKDGKGSVEVKAEYIINLPTDVADVAELTALQKDDLFNFTGELTVVANPTAKYLFVKDETGSTLIFNNNGGLEFEAGQTLAADWAGKVSIYNGLFEAVPTTTLTATEADKVEVEYTAVEADYIVAEHMNEVVTLKGVTYTALSGKNFTITVGETEIKGYNQFGLEIAAPEEGKTYDMVGAISVYNTNVQFQPIAIEEVVTEPAELTLTYVLNETKTKATVTVEDLVEAEESTTVWFLNDDEEAAGMLENGNTFEVSPTNAPETIKVTVRQYDAEMATVLAEGEIEIDFPEAVIVKQELTLTYELNEGKTTATVTVDGLTGQGTAMFFLDDNFDEAAGMVENCTFQVAPLSTPATIKVTVIECNDDMSIIYAEGETTIEFPEPLADPVLQFSVTGNVGQYPESFNFEHTFPEVNDVKVDVYDQYVYVHGWAGVEGYDLKVLYTVEEFQGNASTVVTGFKAVVDGVEQPDEMANPFESEDPADFGYVVATGREEMPNATIFAGWSGAMLNQTDGYLDLYVDETYGYYLSWTATEEAQPLFTITNAETGPTPAGLTYGVETLPRVQNIQVDVYETYSYIHAFLGVEGYDLKVTYDELGLYSIIPVVNGVEGEEISWDVNTEGAAIPTGLEGDLATINAVVAGASDQRLDETDGYIVFGLNMPGDDGTTFHSYYYLGWGDLATAINGVNVNVENATVYNLNGQKMNRLQKGVNIVSGRKVVIK